MLELREVTDQHCSKAKGHIHLQDQIRTEELFVFKAISLLICFFVILGEPGFKFSQTHCFCVCITRCVSCLLGYKPLEVSQLGSVEYAECGVRSVENAECGKCGV